MQVTLSSQHNVENPCVSRSQLLRMGGKKTQTFSLAQKNDRDAYLPRCAVQMCLELNSGVCVSTALWMSVKNLALSAEGM